MLNQDSHRTFREVVEQEDDFVLTTHVNPDGDAVGSLVGLARFLRARGKRVRLINQDGAPPTLEFLLDPQLPIEIYDEGSDPDLLTNAGRVVLVDNSAPDRLGRMERPMLAAAGRTLCIDHHPTKGTPWGLNILDVGACATAAMIYELTTAAGWTPDPRSAEALFAGIATDTGFFRFNSTSVQAHVIAAKLLEIGVEPARCYQQIHERNSEAFMRLLGRALSDLRMSADGAIASLRITTEMIEACRAADEDTSEMMTALLSMDRVRIVALYRDLGGGRVKVSLRSKGNVDVHRLAAEFGGGGHRNASGIVVEGELDRVIAEVDERAVALLAGTPPS